MYLYVVTLCLFHIKNNGKHSTASHPRVHVGIMTDKLMVLEVVHQEECCWAGGIGRPGLEFQQVPALPALQEWPK